MGRRKRTEFDESAMMNNTTYWQYFNRLRELSISMFDWKNLPDDVDFRYLENALFLDGKAVFYREDGLDKYVALNVVDKGEFNVYGYPTRREAYSKYNGKYHSDLTEDNSVIIYNNLIRTNSTLDVLNFSKRLYNLDRIIDVNANAQKTPVLILADETERLTMKNLYKEYDGNAPVIFGAKNLDLKSITVLKTDAPYICDKIYELKSQIWNEALTYLGIANVNTQKKERLVTDEVASQQGGTVASRYSRLEARRQAAEKINKMFGLNIEVYFREDYRVLDNNGFEGNATEGAEEHLITEPTGKE